MPTKSQLTAWNNTPDELNTRLSLGKGTLRQFFESQWLATHQGHCDLKVSENYPNPTCLAPQKICGFADWIHSSLGHSWWQPLYTHPPSHPGACFGSPQEGWVPILLLLLSLTVFIRTHPSMSEQPYPSCSGTHTKNQTAITPRHQSSDAKPQQPWPQMTLTVIVPVGINTTINDLRFCMHNTNDIIGTLPVYLHNFLVTQLNRLPITPEHFSSS